MTTKKTTKKFQLVSKYANYPTWDEQQNAPLIYFFYIPQQKVLKKLQEELHEVIYKSHIKSDMLD